MWSLHKEQVPRTLCHAFLQLNSSSHHLFPSDFRVIFYLVETKRKDDMYVDQNQTHPRIQHFETRKL